MLVMNCLKLFNSALRKTPNKAAITQVIANKEANSFTYSELALELERVEAEFKAQGLVPGDSVPILAISSPQVLVTILACISLELQAVPINPMSSKKELDTFFKKNKISSGQHNSVLVIHTSGSTGSPNKLHYSSDRLQAFMRRHNFFYSQYSDVSNKKVFSSDLICTIPLYHLAGIAFCLQGLMMGRTVHLLRNFSAEEYFTLAIRKQLKLLILVPSMIDKILDCKELLKRKHSIKYCVAIGEPCSERTYKGIEQKLGAQALVAYGLSECEAGIGHHYSVINENNVPAGSCGKLLFGEVKLVNPQGSSTSCLYGELWVRNDTTFACYADSEQNKARFSDGWFKTGDLLRVDEQGNYFCCGRKDNMFCVNGKNIYPQQIEKIFNSHPAVSIALVFPLVSATGKTLVGLMLKFLQVIKTSNPNKSELIEFYLNNSQFYAVPGWIAFVDQMPTKTIGKIDRIKCGQELQLDYEAHCLKIAS